MKEFSIMKWVFTILIVVGLAVIVGYFNLKVFGKEDGMPYFIVLLIVVGFEIALAKFTGSDDFTVRRTAFTIAVFCLGILGLNAVYSFSVQREMSVVRQASKDQNEALKTIQGFKSLKAQRTASSMLAGKKESTSVGETFTKHEQVLYWIMMFEIAFVVGGFFIMYGVTHLRKSKPASPPFEHYGYSSSLDENVAAEIKRLKEEYSQAVKEVAQLVNDRNKLPKVSAQYPKPSPLDIETSGETSEVFKGEILPVGRLQEIRNFRGNFRIYSEDGEGREWIAVHGQKSGVRIYEASNYLGHISWREWELMGPRTYETLKAKAARRGIK